MKNTPKIVLIFLSFVFILYSIYSFFKEPRFDLWLLFLFFVGIFFAFCALRLKNVNNFLLKHPILKKLFLVGLSIYLLIFSFSIYFIFSAKNQPIPKKVDYIFILGGGLIDGNVTSTVKERLDKGLQYQGIFPNAKFIVSGGVGIGEPRSEGEAMEEYLVKKGVKSENIMVEKKASSTYENMVFSKKLIKGKELKVLIVTSDFHLFRAERIASRVGFKAYGVGSKTPLWNLPQCYLRESVAMVKSFLLDN